MAMVFKETFVHRWRWDPSKHIKETRIGLAAGLWRKQIGIYDKLIV